MNPVWTPHALWCTLLHMPAPQSPSEGAGTVTLTGPRPTPYPRHAWPLTAILDPSTGRPRPPRVAAHRAQVAPSRWKLPALIAAAVLAGLTLILGVVGWVALLVVVL